MDTNTEGRGESATAMRTGTDAPVTRPAITRAELATLGDVVIVLGDSGRAGLAYIRGHDAPMDISTDYGHHKDDLALSIRRATVKVGWTRQAWQKADKETRDDIGRGPEWWRDARDRDGLDPSSRGPLASTDAAGTGGASNPFEHLDEGQQSALAAVAAQYLTVTRWVLEGDPTGEYPLEQLAEIMRRRKVCTLITGGAQ